MIGKRCRVKLIPKFFRTGVQAASKKLLKKYPLYADLHNKEVIVLTDYSQTSKTKLSYKVALVPEGDDYWFALDSKYLIPIKTATTRCSCSTRTLMCQGCQCGAFANEKNKQAEKEDAKGYAQPW
jgi:hypothetical protein